MGRSLYIGNSWSKLTGCTSEDHAVLYDRLTVRYQTYFRSWRTRKPERKQMEYPLLQVSENGMHFPTGLVPVVLQAIPDTDISDCRGIPPSRSKELYNVDQCTPYLPKDRFPSLWPHQVDAVATCMAAGRGIVAHATGSGKTLTFATLIQAFQCPAMVVVPNVTLLVQIHSHLAGWFGPENVGIVGDKWDRCMRGNKVLPVVVATPVKYMTFIESRPELHQQFQMLVFDEAHHINVSRFHDTTLWYRIAMSSNAYYRFGFTATPGHPGSPERMLLTAATGRVLHEVKSSKLIGQGLLAPAQVDVYNLDHDVAYQDWNQAYTENILGVKRSQLVVNLVEAEVRRGRSVLIIVNRVDTHGAILHRMIPRSTFVHGGTEAVARADSMKDFGRNGGVLIGTVFGEGVDMPSLDTVVMAAGGKSDRLTIQRLGRALRKDKDNPDKMAKIIDIYDRDGGMLERHSKKRLKVYQSEPAFKVTIHQ